MNAIAGPVPGFAVAFAVTLAIAATATAASELEDSGEPATIDADEVEMDFRTGKRTYKGNVTVVQGALRIDADELVVLYEQGELQKATAYGKPAVFHQQAQADQPEIIGKGLTLTLDEVNDLLILEQEASLQQGPNTIYGQTIVYNTVTDQMKVTGGTRTEIESTGEEGDDGKSGRSRLIITPGSGGDSTQSGTGGASAGSGSGGDGAQAQD